MAKFTKSGADFQVTQSGTLVWTSAWLACATVPALGLTTTGTTVDFGDPARDNAYYWERDYVSLPGSGTGEEVAYAYLTLTPQEYSYTDITLGSAPATADFLRIKARINRSTSPVADSKMMMDLTPIPPQNEWFMVHGGFIPLEQHHPLARAVSIFNDGGAVKLRRLQSVGKDNIADDTVFAWALGNDVSKYDFTTFNDPNDVTKGSVACNRGSFTYGSAKGQPVYYLGTVNSGNAGAPMTRNYARGGSHQINLTDSISLRSVYSIDLDIEPGYFDTDPVLKAPGGKAALRAGYYWKNSLGTAASSDTLSAVPIGIADSTRRVLVMIMGGQAATFSTNAPTAVTIAGISATKLVSADSATNGFLACSIWMASVPTGTTADIVVTWPAGGNWQYSILTYALYHLTSGSAVDTVSLTQFGGTSNPSDTLSTANGGFSFVCGAHLSGSTNAGENAALLSGITGPGYHAMTYIASASSFEANPSVYEAAANNDNGTARTITMAAQTGRVIAIAGISLT